MYKKMVITLAAFIGLGLMSFSLNAAEMKCGAGKCGSSMGGAKAAKLPGCDSEECADIDCEVKKDAATPHNCNACSCADKKESTANTTKATMKCGAGKCGKGM